MSIDSTLNERGERYGNYRDIAGYATLAERACEVVRGE